MCDAPNCEVEQKNLGDDNNVKYCFRPLLLTRTASFHYSIRLLFNLCDATAFVFTGHFFVVVGGGGVVWTERRPHVSTVGLQELDNAVYCASDTLYTISGTTFIDERVFSFH